MTHTKGFTLIELIIVIALIALLATTVILVINPVKIFQEARDSQRIADLGQMNSAMSLMLATATELPDLDGTPVAPNTGCSVGTPNCWVHNVTSGTITANCGGRNIGRTMVSSGGQDVSGTGWVPVKLTIAANGAPISAWPVDPSRKVTATHNGFYSYACDTNNLWEFAADMESARYGQSGTDDVESTDGGNQAGVFEVGTNVQL